MSLTLRTTSSTDLADGSSYTIAPPAGTANGDVMILAVYHTAAVSVSSVTGSWTKTPTTSPSVASKNACSTYVRVASSEPASYTVTLSASGPRTAVIGGYTGGNTVTQPDVTSTSTSASTGTTVTVGPDITPVTANSLHCAVATTWAAASGLSTPTNYAQDIRVNGNNPVALNTRTVPASATGNITCTQATSDGWTGISVVLRTLVASGSLPKPLVVGKAVRRAANY